MARTKVCFVGGGSYNWMPKLLTDLALTRELGIRFLALVPSRVMPETQLGRTAVNGYARYLGVTAEIFIDNMGPRQSPSDVARAVIEAATRPPVDSDAIFTVSANGLAAIG